MTRKERSLTTGKKPEVLNLNESMVNNLIRKTEAGIQALKEQQNEIYPQLKEAEEMYLSYKKPYDDLAAAIDEENNILQTLIGFKRNENDRKQIRVLRSVSNENQKTKEVRRFNFHWVQTALEVLVRENKFLSFETLLRKLLEYKPEYRVAFTSYKNANEHHVRNLIRQSFEGTADASKRKNPKMVHYNGKFGLPEWCDQDRRPLPKYLKETMHAVAEAV